MATKKKTAARKAPAKPAPAQGSMQVHKPRLPGWAEELVTLYESNASNQFLLHGNVNDRILLDLKDGHGLGRLEYGPGNQR